MDITLRIENFNELREHAGHTIELRDHTDGGNEGSITLECMTCHDTRQTLRLASIKNPAE